MRLCNSLFSSYSMGYRIQERASKIQLMSESVGCLLIAMKASYASTKFSAIFDGVVMVVDATSGCKIPYYNLIATVEEHLELVMSVAISLY